jgi:hypothetical protein
VAAFFDSGVPPVPAAETLEIFAFMAAAEESKARGGSAVTLEEVMTTAREEAARR